MKNKITVIVITEDLQNPDFSTVLLKRTNTGMRLLTREVTTNTGISSPYLDAAVELLKDDTEWWAPLDGFHLFAEHSLTGITNLCFWIVFNNQNLLNHTHRTCIDPTREFIRCNSITDLKWFGVSNFIKSPVTNLGVKDFDEQQWVILHQGITAWKENLELRLLSKQP